MRISESLLWLCAATGAIALNTAQPGELMWAYRTDETAFLAAATAAGMEGICAFDEFAKYIGDTSWASYAYDKIGHSLRPDFKLLRTKIVNYATVGGKKTLLQDFDKMYPGKWSTAPGVVTPFSDCVDAVSDTMHDARSALTDTDTVMSALVTDDRENDMANNLKKWANKNLDTGKWATAVKRTLKPFNIPFTSTKAADINELDFAATLAAQKTENGVTSDIWTAAEKTQLQQSLANYKAQQVTVLHDDVIDSMHTETDRLATSVAGCSVAKKRDVLKRTKGAIKKQVRRTTRDLLRRILAGAELVAAKTI
ncbi:hypothetical protein KJ359_007020 [Pestalotiopsis sp. 9143b]|nr:hypothetical protein KJ359_007020 [Pestalotiopsis sp. 9143b]